jgi:hypothetical protein
MAIPRTEANANPANITDIVKQFVQQNKAELNKGQNDAPAGGAVVGEIPAGTLVRDISVQAQRERSIGLGAFGGAGAVDIARSVAEESAQRDSNQVDVDAASPWKIDDEGYGKFFNAFQNPRTGEAETYVEGLSKFAPNSFPNELYYTADAEYELTAYQLTLFMIPQAKNFDVPVDEITKRYRDPKRLNDAIILAQTSVTDGFIIESLSFESICGGGGIPATTFEFSIRSPYRADFLDYMFRAGKNLGHANTHDLPVYLLINWNARDKETGKPVELKTHRCMALRIATGGLSFDESGGTYDFTAVRAGDTSLNQNHALLQEDITFEAFDVKEALVALSYETSRRYIKVGDTTRKSDHYQFSVDPVYLPLQLVDPMQELHSDGANKMGDRQNQNKTSVSDTVGYGVSPSPHRESTTSSDSSHLAQKSGEHGEQYGPHASVPYFNDTRLKKTFTFSKGTPIPKIIENILYSTLLVQKEATGHPDPRAEIAPNELAKGIDPANIERFIPKIIPEVIYRGYDENRRQYYRSVMYRVYRHQDPQLAVDENSTFGDLAVSRARHDKLKGSPHLLAKYYEFYYTGRNTEVKNVDFKFDNHYIIAKQINSGLKGKRHHGILANKYVHKGTTAVEYNEARDKYIPAEIAEAKFELNALQTTLTQAEYADDRKVAASRVSAKEAQIEKLLASQQAMTQAYTSVYASNIDVAANLVSRQGPQRARRRLSNQYAEDLESSSGPVVPPMFQPPFTDVEIPDNYPRGTNEDFDRGANLLAQVVQQRLGGDMVKIELEIRGDPYWIPSTDGADITIKPAVGQPYFVLDARQGDDVRATGLMAIDQRNALTAVYNVYTAKHTFTNGEYTTTLTGVRDHTIDLTNLLERPNLNDVNVVAEAVRAEVSRY